MKAYKYDRTTKEHDGEQVCQIDPVATRREGHSVYLLPAHCTFAPPPEPQTGKKIVFKNGGWEYEDIVIAPVPAPTKTALEACGYSAEERQEQAEQKRRADIMAQLDALDLKCIRALRAISAGTGTEADTKRLAELEAQAEELRKKL